MRANVGVSSGGGDRHQKRTPLGQRRSGFPSGCRGRHARTTSAGFTDESGHYRLRTDNGDDGAVVGKHRVCVVDPLKKRRVPPPYESFTETPLRPQVGSEPLRFRHSDSLSGGYFPRQKRLKMRSSKSSVYTAPTISPS